MIKKIVMFIISIGVLIGCSTADTSFFSTLDIEEIKSEFLITDTSLQSGTMNVQGVINNYSRVNNTDYDYNLLSDDQIDFYKSVELFFKAFSDLADSDNKVNYAHYVGNTRENVKSVSGVYIYEFFEPIELDVNTLKKINEFKDNNVIKIFHEGKYVIIIDVESVKDADALLLLFDNKINEMKSGGVDYD